MNEDFVFSEMILWYAIRVYKVAAGADHVIPFRDGKSI